MVGVGRRRRRHDRDRLPVGGRSARCQDRRALDSADLRQRGRDRDDPLQHVPRRRAGLGGNCHGAERHPARQHRAYPSQSSPRRPQRRLGQRDATGQRHRDDRRGARGDCGLYGVRREVLDLTTARRARRGWPGRFLRHSGAAHGFRSGNRSPCGCRPIPAPRVPRLRRRRTASSRS